MKIFIKTFGCKVNLYDSQKIKSELLTLNHEIVENIETCDIALINSCTVTAEADRKMRQFIHRVKKINPVAKIILAGCFVRAYPSAATRLEIDGVYDIYVDNISKIISKVLQKNYLDIPCGANFVQNNNFDTLNNDRTRAFLKIEDGCNNFCSYCIIPYARGRVRSKSLDLVIEEAKSIADQGFQEIVLVGINLGIYGLDIGTNLCEAIQKIAEIQKIKRIRLSSIEPNFLAEENLNILSKIEKFCPHFHISLQSGSNKILSLMNRKYSNHDYMKICENARKIIKNATITTDIMVGFPGENENDFQDSIELIEKIQFLKVHVFPYSKRPGTKAATFDNQVPSQIKHARTKKMIERARKVSEKIKRKYLERTFKVLYESCDDLGNYFGYTENYLKVESFSSHDIRGKILSTKTIDVTKEHFIGTFTY